MAKLLNSIILTYSKLQLIISFFDSKLRINSLNFFAENIRPEWEDENNKRGHTLTLQYEIKNQLEIQEFFDVIQQNWIYLILLVVGGSIVGSEFVNITYN